MISLSDFSLRMIFSALASSSEFLNSSFSVCKRISTRCSSVTGEVFSHLQFTFIRLEHVLHAVLLFGNHPHVLLKALKFLLEGLLLFRWSVLEFTARFIDLDDRERGKSRRRSREHVVVPLSSLLRSRSSSIRHGTSRREFERSTRVRLSPSVSSCTHSRHLSIDELVRCEAAISETPTSKPLFKTNDALLLRLDRLGEFALR